MTLTHEWQEYDMDYQKAVQDIRTKDGKEYLNCWPNAGKWTVMSDDKQATISDSEVTHVKLNRSWLSEEEQEAGEAKTKERGIGIVREQQPFVLHNPYLEEDDMKLIDYSYHKKYKPNKGLKLGGYRYKGR